MADALPRERWILAGIVLFVVLGGMFPNITVIEHSSEVEVVDEAIHTTKVLNRVTKHQGNDSYRRCPATKPKCDVALVAHRVDIRNNGALDDE